MSEPIPLDQFLQALDVKGLSRSAKLGRVRAFEAHRLRRRFPGATESDVSRQFYLRQKHGFTSQAALETYSREYADFWARHLEEVKRQNTARLQKPLDQVSAADGRAEAS